MNRHTWCALYHFTVLAGICSATRIHFTLAVPPAAEAAVVPLPAGVKAVWDLDKAAREMTPTRERVCLNGLWRWQPAGANVDLAPADRWGYFHVPGFWPGINSYLQEDCQMLHPHPDWKRADVRGLKAAWYQRQITVPANWSGRRITLAAECVHSLALVHVDGKKAGEIRFPSGEVDITAVCRPGSKHVLSLMVLALPLKAVMLSYTDTSAAKESKGTVERRGLCGDVHLVGAPAETRITDVKITTSVRKEEIACSTALEGLDPKRWYELRVEIPGEEGLTFSSVPFKATDLAAGRIYVSAKWLPKKLWDTHTPQNVQHAHVSLRHAKGNLVDVFHPVRFGFREFWIDGKDFYLNGKRIYLSAVPLDNGQVGARSASYEGARETMKRLQSFGINFVYTHNYGCQPGSHVSFEHILKAADDVGMLVGFSQPHFAHYDWKIADADRINGYARHAEFYVRMAQNHPSVVAYSMSHNATSYGEDMNPDMIDGLRDPRTDAWSTNNAKLALRAEAIVRHFDPSRIVYHHSSGNLSSMHTLNFYLNFVPIQEMNDWFEHWSCKGVKPVFLVEYGVPFTWDWTMYRGWYKGEREFGGAKVPWEFCMAEWNAQFFGDRAFQISAMEKQNLRWEAKQLKAGNLWHRWDYPHQVGARDFDERQEIFGRYISDNWRAFRTWGLSANSPWEYHVFWKLKEGVNRGRRTFKVDWDKLQKPGFSYDYTQRAQGQFALDYEAGDWVPTAAGAALLRNNRALLGYIGGKPASITSKDHNVFPGETLEKQLIVINNSRESVTCECAWSLGLPKALAGTRKVPIKAGNQERIPMSFGLPDSLAEGTYELHATFTFSNGETQKDAFTINVLPRPADPLPGQKTALFDPKGETAKLLAALKVPFTMVDAKAKLAGYDVLIVGKDALTPAGPAPNVDGVRSGLKVIIFEQNAKVLQDRFGFRVAEYGLRQAFARVPDHPLLANLQEEHLHDWRGAATLLEPRLKYTMRPRHGPTVKWCDIDVPRAWRCGNRGNIASVLIEKPACGDFLSIVDGGFALQYSTLLEFREAKGMILFCQMDVTGRTEQDPAAEILARNILRYASTWKPRPPRKALFTGDAAARDYLRALSLLIEPYKRGSLDAQSVLLVGAGGGKELAGDAALGQWLESGGRVLGLGLEEADAASLKIPLKKQEHIAAYFPAPGTKSLLAGIGPAEVHNRDPRVLPLLAAGGLGNGIVGKDADSNVVVCQLVPWQFDNPRLMHHRRTARHAAVLINRLACNFGIGSQTPLLSRFTVPVDQAKNERRWLTGFYLDVPEEWDDPYRFFRW